LAKEEGLRFIENKTEAACVIFFKEKDAVFSKKNETMDKLVLRITKKEKNL